MPAIAPERIADTESTERGFTGAALFFYSMLRCVHMTREMPQRSAEASLAQRFRGASPEERLAWRLKMVDAERERTEAGILEEGDILRILATTGLEQRAAAQYLRRHPELFVAAGRAPSRQEMREDPATQLHPDISEAN